MYHLLHFVVGVKKATSKGALEFMNRHNGGRNSCLLYGSLPSHFYELARTPPRTRIRDLCVRISRAVGQVITSPSPYKTLNADAVAASGFSFSRIGKYFYSLCHH